MIHPGLDLPFEGLVRDLGAATPRHVVLVVGVDARAHLAPIQPARRGRAQGCGRVGGRGI